LHEVALVVDWDTGWKVRGKK